MQLIQCVLKHMLKGGEKMNKKGFFTAFGAFLLLLLTGFAVGAYLTIKYFLGK